MKNDFTERMSKLSDKELLSIIEKRYDYQPDAIVAVINELETRGQTSKIQKVKQEYNKYLKNQNSKSNTVKLNEPSQTLSFFVGSIVLTLVLYIILILTKVNSNSLEIAGVFFLFFIVCYIFRLILLPLYKRDQGMFIGGAIVVSGGGILLIMMIAWLILFIGNIIYYPVFLKKFYFENKENL